MLYQLEHNNQNLPSRSDNYIRDRVGLRSDKHVRVLTYLTPFWPNRSNFKSLNNNR